VEAPDTEYPDLYTRFAELIRNGQSDAEIRPLQLAADAFSLARISR
jgi:D-galactose 1-dehydrogenase